MSIWSYGVTTTPQRFDELLPQTLKSLANAGFGAPRIFIDGAPAGRHYPVYLEGYDTVVREPRVRAYCNWMLALWELYARQPKADFYALFQDDLLACKNLRQYLESCEYPAGWYWNLYLTPGERKELGSDRIGWHLSTQWGRGAVGLVFNRETTVDILSHRDLVERPQNELKGWKNIDGAVINALKKIGYVECVHHPSLLFHTGAITTIEDNRPHPDTDSFPGEDFDALLYLKEQT